MTGQEYCDAGDIARVMLAKYALQLCHASAGRNVDLHVKAFKALQAYEDFLRDKIALKIKE